MNPIANLWGYLVCSLNKAHNNDGIRFHARDARNNDELFQFVSEKLNDLNVNGEYLEKLVESMPRRLQAVIDKEGGWTGFCKIFTFI